MRGILPNIAIIFITIQCVMGCVKLPKIGNFPAFIDLSPRVYPPNWGLDRVPEMPKGVWDE
jgi:hypothetical protein